MRSRAARQPKDILWIRSEHVHPDETEPSAPCRLDRGLARQGGLLPPEAALAE